MKKIDEGPIYNKKIKNKREDIKEEKISKKEKKIIDSRKNLSEGQKYLNEKYKDIENMQTKIGNFNMEVELLLQSNKEQIDTIYKNAQAKYEVILEKFNKETKLLLDEFDERRKEIEKLAKNNNIKKYEEDMKKLYVEMQEKWEKCRNEYSESEKKRKLKEENDIKKNNKAYNIKLEELKEKYNLK